MEQALHGRGLAADAVDPEMMDAREMKFRGRWKLKKVRSGPRLGLKRFLEVGSDSENVGMYSLRIVFKQTICDPLSVCRRLGGECGLHGPYLGRDLQVEQALLGRGRAADAVDPEMMDAREMKCRGHLKPKNA